METKLALCRGSIVFHKLTGEIGTVETTQLGNLPRAVLPVRVNAYGRKPYSIGWRAQDIVYLGGNWAEAWLKARRWCIEHDLYFDDPRFNLIEHVYTEAAAD